MCYFIDYQNVVIRRTPCCYLLSHRKSNQSNRKSNHRSLDVIEQRPKILSLGIALQSLEQVLASSWNRFFKIYDKFLDSFIGIQSVLTHFIDYQYFSFFLRPLVALSGSQNQVYLNDYLAKRLATRPILHPKMSLDLKLSLRGQSLR